MTSMSSHNTGRTVKRVTICMTEKVLKKIDHDRRLASRSSFIDDILCRKFGVKRK